MSEALSPGPCARQVSGIDPLGQFILSVLYKRTYRVEPSGRCVVAEEQVPLTEAPEMGPRAGLLLRDSDLYPFKRRTDIVLRGHARAPYATRTFDASITVGETSYRMRLFGERRVRLTAAGEISFSEPDVVDEVPLSFERAYGGADEAACRKYGNPLAGLQAYLPDVAGLVAANPYAYPRNPAGRGFVLEATREAIETASLPNLEDPADVLTPERFAVGRMDAWAKMPVPRAPGWVSHGWFPRTAFLGLLPAQPADPAALPEIALGALPSDIFGRTPQEAALSLGVANGAAPGLSCPRLRGDEEVLLACLSPRGSAMKLRLPGERPVLHADGRKGARAKTEVALHTLTIEPDLDRVTLLWRGSAKALRPYSAEELRQMPFWISPQ